MKKLQHGVVGFSLTYLVWLKINRARALSKPRIMNAKLSKIVAELEYITTMINRAIIAVMRLLKLISKRFYIGKVWIVHGTRKT